MRPEELLFAENKEKKSMRCARIIHMQFVGLMWIFRER